MFPPQARRGCAPSGLIDDLIALTQVARSSQPWACSGTFGIIEETTWACVVFNALEAGGA